MKRLAILGSTGSIGCNALAVVDAHPDKLSVTSLAAGENAALLAEQIARYRPKAVATATESVLDDVKRRLSGPHPEIVGAGAEGLRAVASHPDVDLVLCASSGTAALEAVLAAIELGRHVALANKEILVMAGRLMTDAAARHGVRILPVDSEHNAIHQCLHGRDRAEIRRLILTASGGPFRSLGAADLSRVTPEDALRHPTWNMGRKITIDSATLMNKGLEVIEAHWLFGVAADRIDVVIHPQSIVHSFVELVDGSVIAQLGVPDMRLPIQYAFSYPERWAGDFPRLDVHALGTLQFEQPNHRQFPCLGLAYRALERGGAAPIVLNAANEIAVEAFLSRALPFLDIPRAIERALEAAERETSAPCTLEEVRAIDRWARAFSRETIGTLRSS